MAINMEKITGIGGVFFRAKNPEVLSRWYKKHLGFPAGAPTSYAQEPWLQEQGPTVFAPFNMDTEYFGAASQSWMINFRVSNLSAMVSQLKEARIEVVVDSESYPNGRFARLYDPEGNPIELWEPS